MILIGVKDNVKLGTSFWKVDTDTYKYFKYFLKVIFDIFANFSIFNKVPVTEALYILDNKGR